MKKFHPLLVVLHWLMLPLIALAFFSGNMLESISFESIEKLSSLQKHMTIGLVVVGLMLLRFIIRAFTKRPPHADIGNTLLNKLGVITHYVLYLLVFMIAGSGIGIAIQAGLFDIVFSGSGASLPDTFDNLPPRIAHGIITKVLFITIALHAVAALYHQFVRKDGLLGRMWFGQRK